VKIRFTLNNLNYIIIELNLLNWGINMGEEVKKKERAQLAEFVKIYKINRILNERGQVHRDELARILEVTPRTISNYINIMRDLGANIDHSKNGYRYATPFTFDNFDQNVLLFYSFINNFVKTKLYVPQFISKLIMDQIHWVIADQDYLNIANKVHYELPQHEEVNDKIFGVISDCLMNKFKIKIHYLNATGNEIDGIIEPLKLINYSGSWYIFAIFGNYKSPRLYNIGRVTKAERTKMRCDENIPPDQIDMQLNASFGIYKSASNSGNIKDVTIRFYGPAYYITKNQIFHKKQSKSIRTDETRGEFVEFKFPVSSYDEILGKVFQYHINAEVVAPADFREMWQNAIKGMFEKYGNQL